ncbi:oligogalacturonide-binding protein [Geosporobacter subterraneus DSM 17957]|uniref:Oligogalacturonide-binding protein n=1 Tax=Geosporobacter subterraneus DSM 17957 TaxID=1121919 RepID=A0A1M6D9N0_9FIRM|nr:ABC transporter substrate-binding protein [Geosporobacter subterraneus]SHI69904.1 oligogalacturonide-binding protein [Geosporobacter subterraneus DSM 17957]
MKKIAKIMAIVLTLALLFTACAPKNPSTGNTGDQSKEVSLRFSWWGGDERHEKTLEVIKLYEELNPGVKITAEYGGWQGHLEKITTQILGNTAADIIQINWNWIAAFSKDGSGFYDLNTLADYIDLGNYEDHLLAQTTVNGKLNGLPVGIAGKVFYYNANTWEKAGVPIPKTFDELFAAAPVFKEKLGKDYYPFDLDQYGAFLMTLYYLEQKTGKPFIGDDNQVAYTAAELEEAYEFYLKMVEAGVTPSIEARAAAGNVPVDQTPGWIQGKYGGTYEWDSAINKFQQSLEGDQKIVTGEFLTGIGSHPSALAKVSMVYGINKNTKYPEEAAKFLNFLVSDPRATEILGTSRGIPANKAAVETLVSKDQLKGLTFEGNTKVNEFIGQGISPYFEADELQQFYRAVIEELGYGKLTAAQAAEKTIKEVNRLLKEKAN